MVMPWTPEEDEKLKILLAANASREEFKACFVDRTLCSIEARKYRLQANKANYVNRKEWKYDEIKKLHDFVVLKMTALQISKQLGVTRNAVIGKCRRLGLQLGGGKKEVNPRVPLTETNPVFIFEPKKERQDTFPDGVRLLDLKDWQCRFAIHHKNLPPSQYRFCGSEVVENGSYCEEHYCRVYQKTRKKRK